MQLLLNARDVTDNEKLCKNVKSVLLEKVVTQSKIFFIEKENVSRNGQEAFIKEKIISDDKVAENIVPNFKTFSKRL